MRRLRLLLALIVGSILISAPVAAAPALPATPVGDADTVLSALLDHVTEWMGALFESWQGQDTEAVKAAEDPVIPEDPTTVIVGCGMDPNGCI